MLSDKKLTVRAKRDFRASEDFHDPMRKKMREAFEFAAGGELEDTGQWTQDDLDLLKTQDRPAVTINKIEPMIEAVTGTEVNNRLAIHYKGRENSDKGVAQALNEVSAWARDNDVEEEDTDAIRNALICGIGGTAATMEYDEDPDGKFEQISLDPLNIYWDPKARRPNLNDTGFIGYISEISKEDFEDLFPGKEGQNHVFGIQIDSNKNRKPKDRDKEPFRDGKGDNIPDTDETFLHAEYQFWVREKVFRIGNPKGGFRFLTAPEFSSIKKKAEERGIKLIPATAKRSEEGIRYVEQRHKVFYRAFFSGNELLEQDVNIWPDGFSIQMITARRHHTKNFWYGIVQAMKDPQRLTNKILSAWIHQYNSNPKGGIIYKNGLFNDEVSAKNQIAGPAPFIGVDEPLNEGNFHQMQPTETPSALPQMLSFADNAAPNVTGISMEFLGLAGRDQPIGLEQTRKLATLSVVAPIFSSYRKYRKNNGRLLMFFMKDYFTVQTMLRVVSEDARPFVQQITEVDTATFDIHVDEAPLSPSMRATVFSLLKDFMQFLPENVSLAMLPAFLEYSPMPVALVEQAKKALESASQPDPMSEAFKKAELVKLITEIVETQAKAGLIEEKTETESEKNDLEQDKLAVKVQDSVMNLIQTQIQNQTS